MMTRNLIKVWVDDVRLKPINYDIVLYSVNDVVAYLNLMRAGKSDILLDLDHDAGNFVSEGGDYIRILDWIEKTGFQFDDTEARLMFRIHSANPVGRENMRRVIEKNGWILVQ